VTEKQMKKQTQNYYDCKQRFDLLEDNNQLRKKINKLPYLSENEVIKR